MGKNRVIGFKGKMPWHMPADLIHFKSTTYNKPIIMGRRTFKSLNFNPLPGRHNIVITHEPDSLIEKQCTAVNSVEAALKAAGQVSEIMIIGGEMIYKLFLPLANHIYLTIIDNDFEGDTFFPLLDSNWKIASEQTHLADEKNSYNYQFITFKKHE